MSTAIDYFYNKEDIAIATNLKLTEIIEEIRRRKDGPKDNKGLWQKQLLAAYIGVDKTKMSRLGIRWDEYWPAFLRILDLCDELGIDPREPRPQRTPQEVEDWFVYQLKRCWKLEKPRPQRELIHMAERLAERAIKRATREESNGVQDVSPQAQDSPRENPPGGVRGPHGGGRRTRKSHRG